LRRSLIVLIVLILCTSCALQKSSTFDPLPSWHDGNNKSQIISYVVHITDPESKDFIPPQDRIATFDFDGTIFCEKPTYANFQVCIDHYRHAAQRDSSLRSIQPYKAAVENDEDYMNHNLVTFLTTDYLGRSEEDYINSVSTFIDTAMHAELRIPYKFLFYIPMVELVEYLLIHDFEVYITSGSMIGFLRGALKDHLPFEPSHIIGSRVELEYSFDDSVTSFIRRENIIHNNNATGKAEGIYTHIGKPPVIAAGNTMGDEQMLRYTFSSKYPTLALVINHDDSERDYEYSDSTFLKVCRKNGWLIVSMKEDFETIFVK